MGRRRSCTFRYPAAGLTHETKGDFTPNRYPALGAVTANLHLGSQVLSGNAVAGEGAYAGGLTPPPRTDARSTAFDIRR